MAKAKRFDSGGDVDYDKDLADWTRESTNKLSKLKMSKAEDLPEIVKAMPSAAGRTVAYMLGNGPARGASGIVNAAKDVMRNSSKKQPMYQGSENEYNPSTLLPRKEKNMAKGGTASSRADGCCTKGKTRGKYL
jgi:hypothetical protein